MLPELNFSESKRKIFEYASNNLKWNGVPNMFAKQNYYKAIREKLKYKTAEETVGDHYQFIDMSQIFSNKSTAEFFFQDWAHYSPSGRTLITDTMFAYLVTMITRTLKINFKNCFSGS